MKTGTQVWTYDKTLNADRRDWIGYTVHATDGDIGKIDEMSTDVGRGSVVVDTGFWIFGKKRLIPAAAVTSVDHSAKTVNVSLTKEQIKDAPDYDEMRREDTSYYDNSADYYGRFF
jgi:hypothetical protein